MKLRLLSVDDEPLALRGLELLIGDIEDVELVGTASGCAAARREVARLKPDIVLLDIKMRDGSGLSLAREISRDGGPQIIFVTAFDRFALAAFELAAIDYILKPVELGRLREALQRSRRRLQVDDGERRVTELQAIIRAMREDELETGRDRGDRELWVRRNATDVVRISASTIDLIEAEGGYVRIHVGDRSFLHRASIRSIQDHLSGDDFIRVHRATLVPLRAISEIRRTKFGTPEILLSSGQVLHAGRVYARALRRRLAAGA